MENNTVKDESKCPFSGTKLKQTAGAGTGNLDWWPNQLKLNVLRQHSSLSNPMVTLKIAENVLMCCKYASGLKMFHSTIH